MDNLFIIIGQTLWYFLPALTANLAPVFATHWNILSKLNRPLDGGKTYQGQPIFGPHKTWRGLIVGVFTGALTGVVQSAFQAEVSPLAFLLWGALLGLAALVGDVIKSFFKRRVGKKSGERWLPWDQLDAIFAALIVGQLIAPLPLTHLLTAIIVGGVGMYAVSYVGVKLKIKSSV